MHPSDKCSLVVGFPKWDHRYMPPAQRKQTPPAKWNDTKIKSGKMANVVQIIKLK